MTEIVLHINHADLISDDIINHFYDDTALSRIANKVMQIMIDTLGELEHTSFPYFSAVTVQDWHKPIELDVYVIDPIEGQQLNSDARQKNYATNILSYPSDLPVEVLQVLPMINLGELVICHQVVETQAQEQGKGVTQHLTHLIVHGMLHLLGFDHELGEDERIEMESFEIKILSQLGIDNPYEI